MISPALYWFNPAVESHIGWWPEVHQPPKGVLQLCRDLETLPGLLGEDGDVVLVTAPPPPDHLALMRALGGPDLRHVIAPAPINARAALQPAEPLPSPLRPTPWGWGPDAVAALAPWLNGPPPWRLDLKPLGGKAQSAEWARAMPADHLSGQWRQDPEAIGRPLYDAEAVEIALEETLARWPRAVIKGSMGSAGRDMIRVDEAERLAYADTRGRWLARVLRRHGAVVVEPWLPKLADLGHQIEISDGGEIRSLGTGRFFTDIRGQYLGAALGPLTLTLPTPLRPLADALEAALQATGQWLGAQLAAAGHRGPAGIDSLLYRDPEGQIRLKAVVEINARHTMGRVALALSARLPPDLPGIWLHIAQQSAARAGLTDLVGLQRWLAAGWPPEIRGGKLWRGAALTTPVGPETRTATVMAVGAAAEALAQRLEIDLSR